MVKKKKEDSEAVEELQGEKLEKAAEKESLETVDLEAKKKKLLEKAKKLAGKVETTVTEDLKEQVKIKKRTDMLVPLEEYVKDGIYLGTRVVTPDMKPFIYRRRADGLAIFNTDLIDEKLKEAAEFMAKFDAKDIVLVCRRQAGWRAADMMAKLTGIKVFTKKYPAGVLTNTKLRDFFENELTIVCDSWLDKNSLHDTLRVKKKVLMVCDTNNHANGADKIIIGNNKSPRSLGLIFYLLTREYLKAKELSTEGMPDIDWWTEEAEEGVSSSAGAKFGV
ncbi:30S ribosomal protein S2 [uncultured archaeon]|nr:30S ribosomal protein S2 [uncultured archaeon]